ncbi:S-adenosylmethionine synthase [Candidatus Cyrtobacter comes]|uniref:S-adenosylmethionine synthase n=1 Tax=Candidatus Cyrtobacter comes TaxID=675776 RepID=A0ABU5L7K9_9RICK|nr:methionine adenosyltransferase [Candidatus Cyrtobacter comes]MDZ5761860.1 S-adenosylmethionine synthase [Candidatus Cyrtobacter comes]
MKLFSSESVSNGHPDKIADQISDAILDSILSKDRNARVACEVLVKSGLIVVAGEITTDTWADVDKIARDTLNSIGYNDQELGIDCDSCAVISVLNQQSEDIKSCINKEKLGAGDQGMVFGFACDETDELMPFPILYSHRLMQLHAQKRQDVSFLKPDGKTQLTVKYSDDGVPISIETIIMALQHSANISNKELEEFAIEEIIKTTIPQNFITEKTKILINPSGPFIKGGPIADCGLTGRKIIVDTYGGMARHGGGAFSGKDPSKIDRSGAYIARHIAKSIVAADIARKCEIQLAYSIGLPDPVSIYVECFGTAKISEEEIINIILKNFDLTPQGIIDYLDLLGGSILYKKTAAFGHFGREEFTWENIFNIY